MFGPIARLRGTGLNFGYFMRAVIFLIFDSFGFAPKALDSQAQGLKVPASAGT